MMTVVSTPFTSAKGVRSRHRGLGDRERKERRTAKVKIGTLDGGKPADWCGGWGFRTLPRSGSVQLFLSGQAGYVALA
jgi:hypothetical protein